MLTRFSIILVFILTNSTHQISDRSLKIAVEFMKNINPIGKFNLMCKISVNQAHYISSQVDTCQTVGFGQFESYKQNVIYCADDYPKSHFKSKFLNGRFSAVLDTCIIIGSTPVLNDITKDVTFELNQRVYLLDVAQNSVYEIYNIKKLSVKRIIAVIDEETGSVDWQEERHFVSRRANYQTVQFNAAFFYNPPYTKLNTETWLKIEEGDNDNDTVILEDPNKAEGFNFDILNLLKDDLNSSLKVYWDRRVGMGRPVKSNGTLRWTGTTGILMSGKADIIVPPTPHTLGQASITSFMLGFGDLKTALYVNVNAGSNEKDWLTFVTPFRPHLWTLYVTNSIFIAMGLNVIFFLMTARSFCRPTYNYRSIMAFIGDLWLVLMSYFGRPAKSNFWWILSSTKVWLLFVFLSGNLTWMLYRGSINAELSVRKQFLPFTSPQELYDSDFTVIHTWRKVESTRTLFSTDVTSWIFKRLQEQTIEESYRRTMEEAVNELIQPYSRKVFFTTKDRMLLFPQHRCQVSEFWSNLQPYSFSMTLHKQTPYLETLNYHLLKRKETGVFAQIKARYFGRTNFKSTCQVEITKRPIVMEKVFGANVIFGLGVTLALCLFILEILTAKVFSPVSVTCQSQQDYNSAFLMFAQKWSPSSDWHSKYTLMQFETELSDLMDMYI